MNNAPDLYAYWGKEEDTHYQATLLLADHVFTLN